MDFLENRIPAGQLQWLLAIVSYIQFVTGDTPILGGLEEGKESTTPLTDIRTPKIWNAYDGVRRVQPRSSKSL